LILKKIKLNVIFCNLLKQKSVQMGKMNQGKRIINIMFYLCVPKIIMESPISYFSQMPDPRIDRCKAHSLEDIVFITIAAVICGAETWNEIEAYGESKEDWLREHLLLPNGIPSHDTFNRFFSLLDAEVFEEAFLSWVRAVSSLTDGEVVSIDGKTVRGSRDTGGKHAIHMVSAWASANRLSLGQVKVDEKSNEITAIPKLLDVLVLKGCLSEKPYAHTGELKINYIGS